MLFMTIYWFEHDYTSIKETASFLQETKVNNMGKYQYIKISFYNSKSAFKNDTYGINEGKIYAYQTHEILD